MLRYLQLNSATRRQHKNVEVEKKKQPLIFIITANAECRLSLTTAKYLMKYNGNKIFPIFFTPLSFSD
jgi:hypothetical protein